VGDLPNALLQRAKVAAKHDESRANILAGSGGVFEKKLSDEPRERAYQKVIEEDPTTSRRARSAAASRIGRDSFFFFFFFFCALVTMRGTAEVCAAKKRWRRWQG